MVRVLQSFRGRRGFHLGIPERLAVPDVATAHVKTSDSGKLDKRCVTLNSKSC